MKTRGSRLAPGRSGNTATSRRWTLSCALSLALLGSLARPSATRAAGGSDAATEEGEQAARRDFAQGDAAFKAGRYDEALKEFEAGYAASRRPGFLLNMAHTERKLGHLREARSAYKKFLLVDANSKLRVEVRAVIAELDSALADEDLAERDRKSREASAPPPTTPPPAATAVPKATQPAADQPVLLAQSASPSTPDREARARPFYRRAWFWVAVGAVVLGGAGAAIYAAKRPGADPFHDSGTLGSLGN